MYEIESRAKDARKVFEQPQAARRLTNATPKWRRETKTFYCQLYSKWIYESLVTLLPGTYLETKSVYSHFFLS